MKLKKWTMESIRHDFVPAAIYHLYLYIKRYHHYI